MSVASAASIPVVVVPMLEPIDKGYIRSMLTTPMPTKGVKVEVKMELDWSNIVNPIPIKMAMYPVK